MGLVRETAGLFISNSWDPPRAHNKPNTFQNDGWKFTVALSLGRSSPETYLMDVHPPVVDLLSINSISKAYDLPDISSFTCSGLVSVAEIC